MPVPVITRTESGVVTPRASSQHARVITPSGLPGLRSKSTTLISVQWMAQLATGQRIAQSAICLASLVARVTQDLIRGCLPALQEVSPHSHIHFPSTATTPNTGRMGPKRSAMAIRVDIRRGRLRSAKLSLVFEFMRSEEHTSELQSLRHLVC